MKEKIVLWTLVFILLVTSVLGVGIRPAYTTVIAEETPVYSGSFWVVNNEGQDLDLVIRVEGSLADYITLRSGEMSMTSADEYKSVFFDISLPEELPAGSLSSNIVVEQKLASTEVGFVTAKVVLKHKVTVQGEYPDKYVDTKVNVQSTSDSLSLVSEVLNLGKSDIKNVQTTFYVNDKDARERVVKTESKSLRKDETEILTAHLDRSLFDAGEFELRAVTSFDDQRVELAKKIIIGEPEVKVTYFNKYFVAGEISPYSMDLKNLWNLPLENVFVEVEVIRDGDVVKFFRTYSTDLGGQSTERVEDFFDARGLSVGAYSFRLTTYLGDGRKMSERIFTVELLTEDEFASLSGSVSQTPAVQSASASDLLKTGWPIIIAVLLMLVANTYIIMRMLRKR